MTAEHENDGYGLTIFSPGTPSAVKVRKICFFIVFCLITLVQSCYWVFANSAEPIVMGMPFGMFFIVLFIAIEFVLLLAFYFLELNEMEA